MLSEMTVAEFEEMLNRVADRAVDRVAPKYEISGTEVIARIGAYIKAQDSYSALARAGA